VTAEITMLVSSVYAGAFGGAVFFGKDPSGNPLRAVAGRVRLCRPPEPGETWRLQGTFVRHPRFGDQLQVEKACPVKPAGRLVVHYLTHHPAFRGIGVGLAKVARLHKTFGEELPRLLDREDVEKLTRVLDEPAARKLIRRWCEKAQESAVVAFLDVHHVDVRLASKILRYWPERTVEKLQENPYRLLFLAGWPTVDRLAGSLGIRWDDDRRLVAAVESVIYTRLHSEKDTRVDTAALEADLVRLIGHRSPEAAQRALELARAEGTIVGDPVGGYQAFGCAVMEAFLASRFRSLLTLEAGRGRDDSNAPADVDPICEDIRSFEQASGLVLNAEQRSAVQMAATRSFSVLKGGAGVGKTTALKAVCAAVEARKGRVIQMALAGRAAQRMREATSRDAFTITSALNQIKQRRLTVGEDDLVIIDEASMLDLILVYRLMRALPERMQLLLVGDPFQLSPIGPGLVFHVLAHSRSVPQQELTEVHRQAAGSGIPELALEIRSGQVPSFASFTGPSRGVSFVDSADHRITPTIIGVMQSFSAQDGVQILGVTKRGEAGVETLNAAIHNLVVADKPTLPGWGFAETEPVIHLVNDYDRDLFNGSLGRICHIASDSSKGVGLGRWIECDFDGVTHHFTEETLDRIELAHAITVHKAQGSQFQRVIIPIARSRLLDRTLIYTALTRAVHQAVFIGDRTALAQAITAPPRSQQRQVGFRL